MIDLTCKPIEIDGKIYSQRHGGPFDRGAADSYYNRAYNPHFFTGASYFSPRVEHADMIPEDIEAYSAGYNFNEQFGEKKDWR